MKSILCTCTVLLVIGFISQVCALRCVYFNGTFPKPENHCPHIVNCDNGTTQCYSLESNSKYIYEKNTHIIAILFSHKHEL